jgi:hypothetical protein
MRVVAKFSARVTGINLAEAIAAVATSTPDSVSSDETPAAASAAASAPDTPAAAESKNQWKLKKMLKFGREDAEDPEFRQIALGQVAQGRLADKGVPPPGEMGYLLPVQCGEWRVEGRQGPAEVFGWFRLGQFKAAGPGGIVRPRVLIDIFLTKPGSNNIISEMAASYYAFERMTTRSNWNKYRDLDIMLGDEIVCTAGEFLPYAFEGAGVAVRRGPRKRY